MRQMPLTKAQHKTLLRQVKIMSAKELSEKEFPMFRMEHNSDNNTLLFGPLPEQFFKDNDSEIIRANPDYLYEIDLDRIPTPMALLNWMHHLCPKYWVTTIHIHHLIDKICDIKGWDHHNSN